MLVGRADELALIDRLLDDARRSTGRALVLRGGAGVGKSALLDAALHRAEAMAVLSAQGVESESELTFAGLHQLLRGALPLLPRLPPPQADELRGALGLVRGGAVNRFLVSAAVLSLLAEAAEDRPLLVLVDDAHWLDAASADALVFAARRLRAERVAMVFAAREDDDPGFPGAGLPERRLTGLDPSSAAALLGPQPGVPAPLDVATRLVRATDGNPFALMELRSALSVDALRGADPLPVPLPLTEGLAGLVLERFGRLPMAARTVLLVAASDDTGNVGRALSAARVLDLPSDALTPAEAAGLVTVTGDRLAFRHPLVRSAILQSATSADRRRVHSALAEVFTDDADRSAWHRAGAAMAPDAEAVEGLLETAARARERGGFDAASAASERAAELADASDRTGHLARAAEDAWLAGQTDRARELASRARPSATGPLRRELDRLTGMIEFRCGRPAEAFAILVRAAEQAADDGQAVHLLAEASEAASIAGDFEGCMAAAAIAEGLDPPSDADDRVVRDLVVGMGSYLAGRREEATPLLRRVVAAGAGLSGVVPLAQAGRAAWYLGEESAAQSIFERSVQEARERGQLGLLPYALNRLAACEMTAGRWGSATAYYEEALELARATGQDEMIGHLLGGLAQLAAFRGDERALLSSAEEFRRVAEPRGLVLPQEQVACAVGHLRLSEGRAAEALTVFRDIRHPAVLAASLADRVDAAVHAGEKSLARQWLDALAPEDGSATAAPAGQAHARALVSDPPDAERWLVHACRPETRGRPFDRFRAALALGELRRRLGRRLDARAPLDSAVHGFEALGAERWAERARRELRAAGRSVRAQQPGPNARLTPQEVQVARYAAQGLTNRDVAALLFLSQRTVDFHLRNVFAKLGIASRTELAHLPLDRLAGPRLRRAEPALR